jgi:phosphatidylserine decarboxylase
VKFAPAQPLALAIRSPGVRPPSPPGVVLLALRLPWWALAAFVLALLLLLFFRDPRRRYAGARAGGALGGRRPGHAWTGWRRPTWGPGSFHRVVTFLSVFDVHVQKTPVAGG